MRNLWQRSKFHLSALVLLVPAPFLPEYFVDKPPPRVPEIHRQVTVGPYEFDLSTPDQGPSRGANGETVKDYSILMGRGDADSIRGIFFRVGKPRSMRAAGALADGGAYKQTAHVMLPDQLTGAEELWLTVEQWDGRTHQASMPLVEVLGGRK